MRRPLTPRPNPATRSESQTADPKSADKEMLPAMGSGLRKTGINIVGEIPWGTHFCCFYETKQDLLDVLIPYFKTGLENKEFCLWVISHSELLTVEEATSELQAALPDLDRYVADKSIEVIGHKDWFLNGGAFDPRRVAKQFKEKLDEALARGYAGMRLNGSPAWLIEAGQKEVRKFEEQLDNLFPDERTIASCTYPLAAIGGDEVFDVVRTHRFAIARRQGEWEVVETPELQQAKAEIRRLNEELGQKVVERTGQLAKAIGVLTSEISDRKQSEVELSLAHQRLSYHVENTPLAVIEWDKDLFIKRWSKRAEEVFGWTESEAFGINMYDRNFPIVYEEDVQAVADIAGQLMKGIVNGNLCLNRNYTKDGKVIYCEWYNSVLKDECGNVITILSLVHDITERKRDEDALKKQKEILQKIVDHIPVMINFTDNDGRIKLVNREWEQTLGWSLEEIRNENIDVFAEEYPDSKYRQDVMQFLKAATGEWADFKTRTRDGGVIDTSWARVRLSDGTTIGIGQDNTERRRSEQSLRLFRTLIDQTSDAIDVIDPATLRFLDCNTSAYQGLGYSREEFLTLSVYDINPLVDEMMLDRLIEEMDRSGFVIFESIHRRKDGSTFPVEINLKTIKLERDYRLAVVRDITERKRAEDALRESEDRLRLVIDTIPTMAWSFKPDGTVDYLNKRWIDYTGLSLEQFLEDPSGPIHPDDVPSSDRSWLTVRASGKPFEEELRLRRTDGKYHWFLVRTAPLRDEQGNIVKWYGVSVDIEDRKRAEDRIRATSEQLRALSAGLESAREEEGTRIAREIHDELGSALTSLRWDLESFDRIISESTDPSQRQVLREKIDAMLKLTESTIGSVRRISSELRPTVLDDLGLAAAIEWQAGQFQARTGILCHCDCSLDDLDLDREQSTAIFRIFQEALTNILRHARATRVEIVMTEEAGNFVLTISDNGRGIKESEKSESRSLGLLGMRERAHLIGGEIDITGVEAKRTVITVRIPISGSEVKPETAFYSDASV